MLLNGTAPARTFDSSASAARTVGRVLVVNDSASRRSAIVNALRADGFEVIAVDSGKAAVESAEPRAPDAIVLDLSIPESQSFEVCRTLKAASKSLLPVLYLSSRTSREARARALDAGCDAYLTHPFDPNELCAAVGALIRLKRQEALRIDAAELSSLLDDALDAFADHVALLGPTGEVIAVNRVWANFANANGYCAGGTGLGLNYVGVCAEARGEGAIEAHATAEGIRRVLDGTVASFTIDYACNAPDEERWFRMVARKLTRPGRVTAIVTHTDRTREKLAARAENAARSEADADRRRLHATLEALPVGVWLSDVNGRLTHTNSAAARVWGGDAPHSESVEDYTVYRAWWGKSGIEVKNDEWTLARALRSGKTMTDFLEIQRFDGARGYILNSAALILDADGVVIGGVVVAVDITELEESARERERLVESLEIERSRLAIVFEYAPSFLAVLRGPNYVFERINPSYRALVGHRDPVGKPLFDALPEVRGQGFEELLEAVRTTGVPYVGKQLPVLLARVEGDPLETRYIDLVYQRIADSGGGFSIAAHGVDVTDQVLATEALERSDQRLRDQFAKLPVPTYLWEASGDDFVLLDCNEAAARNFPIFGSGIVGKMSRDIFPALDSVRVALARCLSDNTVVRLSAEFDAGPEFGSRMIDLTIGPQQPDRVLVHAVDTTRRVQLESQLRQAQKMDAVGRLAGGVAHDFNNLLTVIGAHSAFLLETLDSSDVRHEDAEAIHKAGIRASGLTRQLLAFSRKQILKPTVLDLNAIIEETKSMLARLLGEDIEIRIDLISDVERVVADASQIDQVLVNLAVNARDAMPDGGVLTIKTCNATIAAGVHGPRHRIPPGDYVQIEVADTGSGMDVATQARLFEPFFTTKEAGKGTGLGLSTVYGIVKQSSGFILVSSAVGAGTTFEIFLPAVAKERVPDELRVAENISVRGVETILLIEDEHAVREIATRILRRQGYVVLIASNGVEALAISDAFESNIHLVVSDAVMPGMTGAEVVRRLQEERPGLKALFMSGYTDDEILRRGIVSSTAAFIQKPFTLADFARAAREALDS